MEENFALYDRIQSLANAHGVSVSQVERDLGFAEKHFRKWKKSIPNSASLMKVADYFGVSVDYLLGRENDKDEQTLMLEKLARDPRLRAFCMSASKCDPENFEILERMIDTWKKQS